MCTAILKIIKLNYIYIQQWVVKLVTFSFHICEMTRDTCPSIIARNIKYIEDVKGTVITKHLYGNKCRLLNKKSRVLLLSIVSKMFNRKSTVTSINCI